MIFNSGVSAHHVVLVDVIGQAIDAEKDRFPEASRTSWKLTRIVAAYLVGQIIRAGKDDGLTRILSDPAAALAERDALFDQLREFARLAAATLRTRRVEFENEQEPDDFKAEFKNEDKLKELSRQAQHNYVLTAMMSGTP